MTGMNTIGDFVGMGSERGRGFGCGARRFTLSLRERLLAGDFGGAAGA